MRSSLAAAFEFIAEEFCGQRRVDKASGDQVDSHRCELEREVGDEGRECNGDCRRDPEADAGAAGAGAAHEQQRAARSDLGAALRATWSVSKRCVSRARRACSKSISSIRP